MRKRFFGISSLLIIAALNVNSANPVTPNGVTGFATYNALGNCGVTGGGTGKVVHVNTRAELERYASSTEHYVIIIDSDITGGGVNDLQDELYVNSNKTIIGAGSGKTLNGVALLSRDKQNIIIRNIRLTRGRIDGVAFHNCHHVWVDHCDFSNSYDGLLDITNGSDFVTVSWVRLHDHNKVSITNSGTCHYDDYNKERVTFAHCMFDKNTQRNPRIGYGKMHIYNSYWENIKLYCIGFHSQAQVLSENNYFSATARHPFCNQYTDLLPYCGYLTDKGSFFAKGDPGRSHNRPFTDISYSPLDYYEYSFDLDSAEDVAKNTPNGVGPQEGIQYEPILNPGNGAIDIPLSQSLSWGTVDGASSMKMYFGTKPDKLKLTSPEAVKLRHSTRYYWRVAAIVDGKEHMSPLYTFTTASNKATKPYPESGSVTPWLRYPSSGTEFCTDMPLTWCQAADAVKYKVYLSDKESSLNRNLIGETSLLSLVPPSLSTGIEYYWRVDAVKANGSVVKGDVWTFGSPNKRWHEGKNEAEDMYISGIAFLEKNESASNGGVVVGDQGPGAICGTWEGETGRYAIETAVFNQKSGANYVGVSINGKLIDEWLTTTANNDLSIRKTRNALSLQRGDEIRIDFVAGLVEGKVNESRSRIDYINIQPVKDEFIEVTRPSGIYHSPQLSIGHDCEYLLLKDIVFTDTLGTIGKKGDTQVRDKFCSWVSKTSSGYTFYVKQTAIVKFVYRNSDGKETEVIKDLDKNVNNEVTANDAMSDGRLYAIKLYKTLPAKTIYRKPIVASGKDYELVWSSDVIFVDKDGIKGNPGKTQMRDGYDEWIKYVNPMANEVLAKKNPKAFIDPETDKECGGVLPRYAVISEDKKEMADNSSYVVGTDKNITYCIEACRRIKFYYTGSGGSSTSVRIKAVNLSTGEEQIIEGAPAPGKNMESNTAEVNLDPQCRYKVTISGTTGDMVIYAVKLWHNY